VRAGQRVEIRAGVDTITIHALPCDSAGESCVVAAHPRAARRGSWVVDPAHWDALPDGHTRATTTEPGSPPRPPRRQRTRAAATDPLSTLLAQHAAASIAVAHRPLAFYDSIAGLSVGDGHE